MKTFLTVLAATLALVSLTATGCSKAKATPSRLSAIRAKAIAAPAPLAELPETATAAPLPAVVEEAPVPTQMLPIKRVKNPSLPGWQQLEPEMTKQEVEEFVGRPNAKNETKWVYKNGAAVRFTDKGLLASYEGPRE